MSDLELKARFPVMRWERWEPTADEIRMRWLLVEWERYARTLADAGVIAIPERLLERTVGLLDATAV